MNRTFENKSGSTDPVYDVIIIGGGPAALSAAIYAARKVLKTVVISKDIGGQVTWTYDVDNYLGFSQIDAADLIAKFEEHVTNYDVEKLIGVEVTAVELADRTKKVTTEEGNTYLGMTVIIATGKRYKLLNVPGEKEFLGMGVSYCSTCDAPLFAGLDVVVAGGGNSALEAALDLVKVANQVYVVALTPLTGDPLLQNKVTHSPNVEVFTGHEILRIVGESGVEAVEIKSLATGEGRTLDVQGVMIEIGLMPNSELFVDTLEVNEKGEIVVDIGCCTDVAGVFACGDVTDVPFKQVIVAAGEGAKAALSAYEYIINLK